MLKPPVIKAEWRYASASAITNTTAVEIVAARAGARNYLAGLQISNTHATVGTLVQVLDGSTVIWQFYVSPLLAETAVFPVPLMGSPATSLSVKCVTNGSSVFVNAQGFAA